ncbi:hypothetical protein [Leucobacter chromiireducens]|uniref:hypothetical protein n=1 Tax=Leucobacter chromiireducens TaxID=283877 RepID=UPI000F62D4B3|nr:hypothetical protein [Leucobacter chromiireducens]
MKSLVTRGRERPPVDRRLLWFDRASLPLALVVVAVFVVLTVVVPRIDRSIPWSDPIVAGDQLALSDTIVVTPVPGWNLEAGYRVAGDSREPNGAARLVSSGVTIDLTADTFSGTPAELLAQVELVTERTQDPSFRAHGGVAPTATSAGVAGVRQAFAGLAGDGQIFAFVLGDSGVTATVTGPSAQVRALSGAIEHTVASISEVQGGEES